MPDLDIKIEEKLENGKEIAVELVEDSAEDGEVEEAKPVSPVR